MLLVNHIMMPSVDLAYFKDDYGIRKVKWFYQKKKKKSCSYINILDMLKIWQLPSVYTQYGS